MSLLVGTLQYCYRRAFPYKRQRPSILGKRRPWAPSVAWQKTVGMNSYAVASAPNRLRIDKLRPCIAVSFHSPSQGLGLLIHHTYDRQKFTEAFAYARRLFGKFDDVEIEVVGGDPLRGCNDRELVEIVLADRDFIVAHIRRFCLFAKSIRINFNDESRPNRLEVDFEPGGAGLIVKKVIEAPSYPTKVAA